MRPQIRTRSDRLWRLKIRMGWRPPRYVLRLRPGGILRLPPPLTRIIGLRAGDQVNVQLVDKRLMVTWGPRKSGPERPLRNSA